MVVGYHHRYIMLDLYIWHTCTSTSNYVYVSTYPLACTYTYKCTVCVDVDEQVQQIEKRKSVLKMNKYIYLYVDRAVLN